MWPGEQQPGDGPNAQDPYANPYQQPHPYQQPNPYAQPGQAPGQTPPWAAPTVTSGPPEPPRGGGEKTKLVAVVATAVVVVAAAVTGFLVLGGGSDDEGKNVDPTRAPSTNGAVSPTASGGADERDSAPKPVIAGWKAVLNPSTGVVFDVPPEWGLKAASWTTYVADESDPDEKPLIGFTAPALLKEKWCSSDEDGNGSTEDTALAAAGSRGERGARTTDEAARNNASLWLYGAYTQPDKKTIKPGPVEPYTTSSGIKGSLATAASSGVPKKGKCDSDGKVTSFAFENAKGDFVSWTFFGATGVPDEVPDATVRKILSTVREGRS